MPNRAAIARIAAVVLSALLPACGSPRPPTAAPAARPPVQLMVLGDSLAFGTGAGDTSGGFAFRVYRALAATRPGSQITNAAIGGSTAADVLRLQVGRLHERRFDVIVLCVGGNDVVRELPAADFARQYRALVAAIRSAAPRTPLVAVGVPDISVSPLFADGAVRVRRLARADDRAARTIIAAAGGRYVDLFGVTQRMRDAARFLSADRFHPSDAGHALIAAAVLPAVDAALRAHTESRAGAPRPRA